MLILIVASVFSVSAQNLTNEGTEFYIAFPEVFDNANATFEINISSRVSTTGTVEITGTGFSQNFSVVPGVVTTVTLISGDADIIINQTVIERAIHVTSVLPVTVYASTFHSARSEASICLPVTAFSSDYMATTYPTMLKSGTWYQSEFIVVAGPSACDVTITPACITENGSPANTPISVHLEPNEVYQVQAQTGGPYDLTGSTITADNGTDKFAVYNGHIWTYLSNCGNLNADPLFEQAYPLESWGSEYILMITLEQNDNAYRVVAKENGTTFTVDGVPTGPTLNTGDVYDGNFSDIDEGIMIESNKPCAVTQTMTTGVCSGNGDPSMIVLNSNEQMYLDTVTFYAATGGSSLINYVNVVTRSDDTTTMQFNATPIVGWTPLVYDNSYSYKLFATGVGSHTLTTTGCGFLAYAYGMGSPESYFYAAGARVNSIDDSISISSINTGVTLCDLDSIQFTAFTSGGTVVDYNWTFGDGGISSLESPIHTYQNPGTYDVSLIVEYLCFTDTISDQVVIYDSPIMIVDSIDVSCFNWSDGMITTLVAGGTPTYNYLWSNNATTPDITGLSGGIYTVVVTDQNGCYDSATVQIEEPAAISVSINPAGPYAPTDGVQNMIASPAGGTWSASCGACITTNGGQFDPLVAGPGVFEICYNVTVDGCDSSACTFILVDEDCAMIAIPNDAKCFGDSNGSFVVNFSGGVGVATILLTDDQGNQVNLPGTNVANSLTSGWYYIDIADQFCTFIDSIYIGEPPAIDFTFSITDPLCNGNLTGYVEVDTVLNNTGAYNQISYYWDPNPLGIDGIGEDELSDVGAGEYTLLVYDENACYQSKTFFINEPPAISLVEFGSEPAYCRTIQHQSGNGVVFVSATGGTGNLIYDWLNVYDFSSSITSTWAGLDPSLYKITVTDDNNCTLEEFILLDSVNPIADFTPVSDGFDGPGEFEGTELLNVQFTNQSMYFANPNNPIADTTFKWSTNANEGDSAFWFFSYDINEKIKRSFTGENEYLVCLVARNFNGCSDTLCKVIAVHAYVDIFNLPNIFTPGASPNNEFHFPLGEGIDEFNCIVFNRYGADVFKFESIEDRWDGNNYKNGNPCKDGVYFYSYTATATNGTFFEGQGTIQILRHK